MLQKGITDKSILHLLPPAGIICFGLIYLYSSTLYPGGSQVDIDSVGYDWVNNYWCNLLNVKAMNGDLNPARPYAIAAMLILCISLLGFFINFANGFCTSRLVRKSIIGGGALSMGFASLIFTQYHDLMTILSSISGIVVVVGIIREIVRNKLTFYKITGIFCILLLVINNYIYYSKVFINYLPLLQKMTFIVVLFWVIGLNRISIVKAK